MSFSFEPPVCTTRVYSPYSEFFRLRLPLEIFIKFNKVFHKIFDFFFFRDQDPLFILS